MCLVVVINKIYYVKVNNKVIMLSHHKDGFSYSKVNIHPVDSDSVMTIDDE